jgi:hypothetical protein
VIAKAKTILWREEMQNMIPWVQKLNNNEYALLLEYDGQFECLMQTQHARVMWYDNPKDSYNWVHRVSVDETSVIKVCFTSPKKALQTYLELAGKLQLSRTEFNLALDLDYDERYCLLEPAQQWLELHQWDLQRQCDW